MIGFIKFTILFQYPQIILPAAQKSPDQTQNLITVTSASPVTLSPSAQPPPPPPPPDTRPLRNLEDMKGTVEHKIFTLTFYFIKYKSQNCLSF